MSSQQVPHVSIVMPSLNQRAFLEEAVASVMEQEDVVVELLVFDPGSVDGSRQLLETLAQRYSSGLRLFFEPDTGQSDAVNKGMSKANGNILGWLNSDDRLRPGVLRQVTKTLSSTEPKWLYGRAGVIDARGGNSFQAITAYKNLRGRTFSRFKLLQENFISQMAVFWTRALWDRAGGLATEKHLDMDYDLWLRFAKVVDPVVLKDVLADFRVHADAKGSRQATAQLSAAFQTACEHAQDLGLKGQTALVLHRILMRRTRLAYRLLKPRSVS